MRQSLVWGFRFRAPWWAWFCSSPVEWNRWGDAPPCACRWRLALAHDAIPDARCCRRTGSSGPAPGALDSVPRKLPDGDGRNADGDSGDSSALASKRGVQVKAELATAMGWSLTTIAIYAAALRAFRWRNAGPFLIPVATGAALIVLVIKLCGVAYPAYAEATGLLRSLIGPATVALAVPLFVQFQRLRPVWRELSVALLAACMVAILSSVTLARALGASSALVASVAPKSATMPIAMPVAERFGGQASIAALAVAITGRGRRDCRPILRIIGVQDARVRGLAWA